VRGSYDPSLVESIPMNNMRKAIAKNMVLSKQISPHVNSVSEVDLSHLVKFREGFKNEFLNQEGFKLTYTPLIMKAIIDALKEFPLVNSSLEGDNIIQKKYINLGFAVAVPGQGLTVPNVKEADTLNMTGLCRMVNRLADKARKRKLSMDEMSDGTYTFSNVGSFGTLFATPIILQPQVGIYASGAIKKRVMVVKDDAIAVRSMMYGTHSYDHRLVDGELGGLFLEAIHRNLREMDPSKLF
jgi:2-oxoglutarate dehydrogenase E2 component (dihydrolipoamide succinyltransferase)